MAIVPRSRLARQPARADSRTGPDAGFLETAAAAFRTTRDEQSLPQGVRLAEAYVEFERALVSSGVDRRSLYRTRQASTLEVADSMGTAAGAELTELDPELVWAEVDRRRRQGDARFRTLPQTREEFEARVLGRNGGRAEDQATIARGSTAGQFAGGMVGAVTDPYNAALTVAVPGGVGATVARRVATEALVNMAVEAVQQPGLAANKARLGEQLTGGDIAMNIATAGAGAAVLRGGFEGIAGAAPRAGDALASAREAAIAKVWDKLPEPLRAKWGAAAKVDDVGLSEIVETVIGRDNLSPDERAAVGVLRRDAEMAAANPFIETGAGVAAHAERSDAAMRRILSSVPEMPRAALRGSTGLATGTVTRAPSRGFSGGGTTLDDGIVQFFVGKGYSREAARGIAAGVAAESRNAHQIVNPSSGAYGLGQWLGPRKEALFRRYGRNPTREQQLEFLHWELQGGDHGGARVRAAQGEAATLSSYIRDFMRPAAGAETDGDLARGMAALGRDGEAAPTPMGSAPTDEAALRTQRQAEIDRLNAETAALTARQDGQAVDPIAEAADALATPAAIDTPDIAPIVSPEPVLRPEIARAAGETPSFRGRKLPVRNRPSDLIEFLTDRGGVRDEFSRVSGKREAHDLRRGRGWGTVNIYRSGRLVRNEGMDLDLAAELAHEAGFFVDRPSVAEFIEAVDRAVNQNEKIYSRFDLSDVAARAEKRAASEADEELMARRDMLRDTLGPDADTLDDDLLDEVLIRSREGDDEWEALMDAVAARNQNLLDRAAELDGEADYDWRADLEHAERDTAWRDADGRAPAARGGEPEAAGSSARGGGQAGAADGAIGDSPEVSAAAARAFDDPDAEGARLQSESHEHDLRMAAEAGDEDARAVIDALDAEAADLDAIRSCLNPKPDTGDAE